MKILSLVLGFCLMTSFVFADVTAEIIGKDIDTNGNIVIKTQYKVDGVEVPSRYPKENGKYYWVTRYSIQNFAGMDAMQIQVRIDQDLRSFSESLILKPFQEQLRNELKTANENVEKTLDVIGHNLTVKEAKMIVDTDFDGIEDKELTCKTDGSKIEKVYTVIPIIE